jgi:glycosyltransferase involved in cell wall biosynthesis
MNTNLRVLILLTYYYPHWTGLTQYAKRLAEALSDIGLQVKVLTCKHQSDLADKEEINRVQVIRSPVWLQISRTLISPALFISLIREIRNTDRVVIYLPYAEAVYATILARLLGKKIVLIQNGDLKLPAGFVNRLLERLYYFTTGLAISLADAVVAQTEDYASQSRLLNDAGNKLKIILPLYPQQIGVTSDSPRADAKHNPVIGFAGRFVEEKGFDRLFKAIPEIVRAYPEVRFVYAGETNISYENFYAKNKSLIGKVSRYVIFAGRLDEAGMRRFYRSLDILVIPSRSDCFPSVEAEALISGIPVVVSDIPGARMPVKMTGMGILVDANDPKQLAAAIVEVYRNRSKFRKNWPKAISLFDYEKTFQKYLKVIE